MTNQSNGKLRMGMPGLEPLASAPGLHPCIGSCLGRIGHNLHQFDRIPIGIVDPVLQIEI